MDRPRGPLPTRVSDLAPLPAAYHDTLDGGLADLALALDPEARAAIDAHARLLLAWTSAINLTAVRDPAEVARRHVLDSLAAVPAPRSPPGTPDLARRRLPGLPLAAALPSDPRCGDFNAKKVRFLET